MNEAIRVAIIKCVNEANTFLISALPEKSTCTGSYSDKGCSHNLVIIMVKMKFTIMTMMIIYISKYISVQSINIARLAGLR